MSEPDRGLAGRIRIQATRGPLRAGPGVTLLMAGSPRVSGGAGGWQESSRPGRRPVMWWPGGQGRSQTIEALLDRDAIADQLVTVERRLQELERMGVAVGGEDTPPPVRLLGDLTDPYSRRGGLWVIQGVELGERAWRRDGQLQRVALTIELHDFEDAPSIRPASVRRTRPGIARPRRRVIRTLAGDTLRSVAVRELGFGGGWQRIRAANPSLRRAPRPVGPDDPLRVGIALRLG